MFNERRILGPVERGYWWVLKRTHLRASIDGIDFVFIETASPFSAEQIQVTLGSAIEQVKKANGGFGELVLSHLRMVACLMVRQPYATANLRAYLSPFRGHEASNARYLACQLVWAATSIRLTRDARFFRRAASPLAVRKAAFEAQLRFVSQFPDGEEWTEYLMKNHPDFPSDG